MRDFINNSRCKKFLNMYINIFDPTILILNETYFDNKELM